MGEGNIRPLLDLARKKDLSLIRLSMEESSKKKKKFLMELRRLKIEINYGGKHEDATLGESFSL